jgi:hypothetical protein
MKCYPTTILKEQVDRGATCHLPTFEDADLHRSATECLWKTSCHLESALA